MRFFVIFICLMSMAFFNAIAEDRTCETKYSYDKSISLYIKPEGEALRLHAVVLCTDTDSAIVKIRSRSLENKIFRINHYIRENVGEVLVFYYFENMVQD
ncbi:hypothetical protein [Calditerrivibrio sp.]|uniref:hypothetical protein n=1 Tax=Calditerrivibrio sp. TaxID=2792612 RepID=UPI003D0DA995